MAEIKYVGVPFKCVNGDCKVKQDPEGDCKGTEFVQVILKSDGTPFVMEKYDGSGIGWCARHAERTWIAIDKSKLPCGESEGFRCPACGTLVAKVSTIDELANIIVGMNMTALNRLLEVHEKELAMVVAERERRAKDINVEYYWCERHKHYWTDHPAFDHFTKDKPTGFNRGAKDCGK